MIRDKALVRELNNFFPDCLAKLINEYDIDFPDKTHKRKMESCIITINCEFKKLRWELNGMRIPKKIYRFTALPGVYYFETIGNYSWIIHHIKSRDFMLQEEDVKTSPMEIVKEKLRIEFVREYVFRNILPYYELNNEWRERYDTLVKENHW